MTAKFDWNTTSTGKRWCGPYQVYRYQRVYVPVDVNDLYDTGESVIITKNKVRGKGKAMQLRFESEDGKDFQLLGYSIPYTAPFEITQ